MVSECTAKSREKDFYDLAGNSKGQGSRGKAQFAGGVRSVECGVWNALNPKHISIICMYLFLFQ